MGSVGERLRANNFLKAKVWNRTAFGRAVVHRQAVDHISSVAEASPRRSCCFGLRIYAATADQIRRGLVALLMAAFPAAAVAQQTWPAFNTPATSVVTAPAVSPSAAWARYTNAETHTVSPTALTTTPPEVAALARALGADRVSATGFDAEAVYVENVFNYVRHNIATEFRFGLGKGGRGALIDQSGTPFDQAELMVTLLKERPGVYPTFQIGTISLSASQFGKWSGFVKGLDEGPQSFQVDAKAACQFLADGGIPLVIGGGSDCSTLSGNLGAGPSAVTMGHIWVSLGTKLYDPSFKEHVLKARMDIAAAAGCGTACGSGAASAATSGPLVVATANSIQHLNEAALDSKLLEYAQRIEGTLRANKPNGELDDVLGGKKLNLNFSPGATPPYAVSANVTGRTSIPDQFRSKVRIQALGMDKEFYVDELSGRSVRLFYRNLYIDNMAIASGCDACATFVSTLESPIPNDVSVETFNNSTYIRISATHPYKTDIANYASEESDYFLADSFWPGNMIIQWGSATDSTIEYWRNKISLDQATIPPNGSFPFYINSSSYFADVVARNAHAVRLVSGATSSSVTNQHTIGFSQWADDLSPILGAMTSSTSMMSIQNHEGSAGNREAAFQSVALLHSMAEKDLSLYWLGDVVNRFSLFNRQGVNFVTAPGSAIGSYLTDGFDRQNGLRLQNVVSQGFSYIIPASGAFSCVPVLQETDTQICISRDQEPSYASQAGRVSYQIGSLYKGALMEKPAPEGAKPPVHGLREKRYLNIDEARGVARLRPPPDLVTGVGEFPRSLSFERYYDSSSSGYDQIVGVEAGYQYQSPFPASDHPGFVRKAEIGGGWYHNWKIGAQFSSGFGAAMGSNNAISASYSIAAAVVLRDLYASGQFLDKITAIFTGSWLESRILNNTVTVYVAPKIESFVRLPSSEPLANVSISLEPVKYQPQSDTQARLSVARGALSGPYTMGSNRYSSLSAVYTGADGSALTLQWHTGPTPSLASVPAWPLMPIVWNFPDGMQINFSYDSHGTLASVTNNLGRSLIFGSSQEVSPPYGYRLVEVSEGSVDGAERKVQFSTSGCRDLTCDYLSVRLPGQSDVVKYSYIADSSSPDPAILGKNSYRLRKIFTPSDQVSPYQTIRYDAYGDVAGITDARANTTSYYVASKFGTERWKRSEMLDALGGRTLSIFDERGSLLEAENALKNKTIYTYDSLGRKLTEVKPEGNWSAYNYDVRSNLTKITRYPKPASVGVPASIATEAHFGEPGAYICGSPAKCNRPISEVDGLGAVTDYTWTAQGQLEQIQRPSPAAGQARPVTHATYSMFNGVSFLTRTTQSLGAGSSIVTDYEYEPSKKYVPRFQTVRNVEPHNRDLQTEFTFNGRGDLVRLDPPGLGVANATDYRWDWQRRVTHAVSPDPSSSLRQTLHWEYNPDGLVVRMETGVSNGAVFTAKTRKTYAYDGAGNRTHERTIDVRNASEPVLALTQMFYDPLDRLVCTAVRMRAVSITAPPATACDMGSWTSGDPDRLTSNVYDAAGQLTMVKRGIDAILGTDFGSGPTRSIVEQFSYTANGRRETVKDARLNLTTYRYDGYDRLKKQEFPISEVEVYTSNPADYEEYAYDENGNRTLLRRRNGKHLTFTYDALNRMTLKQLEGDSLHNVAYAYDEADRLKTAIFAETGQGTTFTYDKAGRLLSDTTFGRSLTNTYDDVGNRTGLSTGSYGLTYAYDAANRLTDIQEVNGGMNLVHFTYEADFGLRSAIVRGNGGSAYYAYDGAMRLSGLIQQGAGTKPLPFVQSFDYNPASQVIAAAQQQVSYVWRKPVVEHVKAYDGLNRDGTILAAGGYDAAGNVTGDGVRSFKYDLENRLIEKSAGPAGPKLTIEYDPTGRLAKTTVVATSGTTITEFQYDGDRLIAEYSGSSGGMLQRYVHGDRVDEPLVWYQGSARNWLHADRQGSIVAVSDANGDVTPYTYDAYGVPDDWGGVRFRYTGQIALHEAELYHYKARVYDPQLGRFLQTDPTGYDDGLNWYAYVGNDPLNGTDPSGETCKSPSCQRQMMARAGGAQAVRDYDRGRSFHSSFVGGLIAGEFPVLKVAGLGLKGLVSRITQGTIEKAVSNEVRVGAEIALSRSAQGEAAQHAADAIAAGHPDVLTIDRLGAAANRGDSIGGMAKVPGKHLDEYPPAMFAEGGKGASVRAINPRDNMSAGACIGNACRGLPDGTTVRIKVTD